MFERDYLMRIVAELGAAIRRSLEAADGQRDPEGAAEHLEAAIGEATAIDGGALLSLAPESMASVMQVSGTDPAVTEYIARSLLLAARYHEQAGHGELGSLRRAQAEAVAAAYGHALGPDDGSFETMSELAEAMEAEEYR